MKVVIVGNSGAGKTALYGSLVNAGYKVGIIQADGNAAILDDAEVVKPANKANLSVQLIDSERPDSWGKMRSLLMNWPAWGPVEKWDDSYVLGVDSLSLASRAALSFILKETNNDIIKFAGANSLSRDELGSIYGGVKQVFFNFVSACVSPSLKCHFVGTCHFRDIIANNTLKERRLAFEGSALSMEVPKRFGDVWELKQKLGSSGRVLLTRPDAIVGRKCSAPSLIKPEEEADLGKIFNRLKGV